MARKPKAQLHPDVAAALPVAIAAMGGTPAPARPGRKARADAPLPDLPTPGRDDTGLNGAGADATPAEASRRPKRPAAVASALEGHAPRRGPKRRTPPEAPELVEANTPGHEAGPQLAGADAVPVDTAPGGDTQPPLPGLHAPLPAQPAAHWDRATDTVRFDWPAIERTAAANGPNQGMAKLLVAARAEGARSRWPL